MRTKIIYFIGGPLDGMKQSRSMNGDTLRVYALEPEEYTSVYDAPPPTVNANLYRLRPVASDIFIALHIGDVLPPERNLP